MKKYFTILILAGISFNSFSQTIKDNIDKQAKDKSTMDRAAKADLLIQPKTISNNSQLKNDVKQDTLSTVKKIKSKKNKYKKKYNSSSK